MTNTLFKLVVACFGFCMFASGAQAQSITGDWQGALQAGGATLHLALHVRQNSAGTLSATLDSLDQGAMGIPVSAITIQGSKLQLEIAAIHGSYAAELSKDGKQLAGTWTQGSSLPLNFEREVTGAGQPHVAPAPPTAIDGDWAGALDTGGPKLRVIFHIANTTNGMTAVLNSLDQGAKIPSTAVHYSGNSLRMEFSGIAGTFSGTVNADHSAITGTWTQGGNSLPLALARAKNASELQPPRPQDPKRPYPYREEEVSFSNPSAAITLSGTLTVPRGRGPFPAAILISGSGAHDRDEALLGHRPFLVLADSLTRHGIAVLRYDKRGVARSGGNYAAATMRDFASDAAAALSYLTSRPETDHKQIGLIGHSEGGAIAPMLAADSPAVAFMVLLAGPGVPGDALLPQQVRRITLASGGSAAQAAQAAELESKMLAVVKNEKDPSALEKDLRNKFPREFSSAEGPQMISQVRVLASPWFRDFLNYDPASALRKVRCPVLALDGSKDVQVDAEQNLPAIRKALAAGGNKNVEADELPGLNHLFQRATTGSPSEYSQIQETIAPAVLEKISVWIHSAVASSHQH